MNYKIRKHGVTTTLTAVAIAVAGAVAPSTASARFTGFFFQKGSIEGQTLFDGFDAGKAGRYESANRDPNWAYTSSYGYMNETFTDPNWWPQFRGNANRRGQGLRASPQGGNFVVAGSSEAFNRYGQFLMRTIGGFIPG
ncbi:MAG: hypothetical protein AB8B64_18945, partial [Granulosicoccus sp.]